MNSYQKLKKRIEFLEYIVKKNDAELEYLSQNVDLTLNSKVGSILHPYLLRSNLKRQIETFFLSGEHGGIVSITNNSEEKYICKADGLITKLK